MTRDAERVLGEALGLPEPDRAELAARLLSSLLPEGDQSVDAAWIAEIERRCADLDAGTAVTSDWETLRRRIEEDIIRR